MSDVLFVKTSSLGDVIHHMPALTEARARRPGACALRGWWRRRSRRWCVCIPRSTTSFRSRRAGGGGRCRVLRPGARSANSGATLRARNYDAVIDTQGLIRSALIARAARGRRHGYDAGSIRERAASLFYDVRHSVARDQHAIARNRALTGLALGYAPEGPPDYGLDRARLAPPSPDRYAVLLHATARARQGMAGGALDRARPVAARTRSPAGAAVGQCPRAGAQPRDRCRVARVPRCPICSRSTRSRA